MCNTTGYPGFTSADYLNAPTFYIGANPFGAQGGAITAANSVTGSCVSPQIGFGFTPTEVPGAWWLPDGPINQGMLFHSGTGAPSGTN